MRPLLLALSLSTAACAPAVAPIAATPTPPPSTPAAAPTPAPPPPGESTAPAAPPGAVAPEPTASPPAVVTYTPAVDRCKSPKPPAEPLPGKLVPVEGATSTQDMIRNTVRRNIRDVRDCYSAGLARDPALRGRVQIRFTIEGDGSVCASVITNDTVPDPEVGRCIAGKSMDWRFSPPASGGRIVVTYPFILEPG